MPASDLQTTNCPNCGAALTGGARPGATLRCEFCGTSVRLPASPRSTPANVTIAAQGNLSIGEFVSGDKIVTQHFAEVESPLSAPPPQPVPTVLNSPALPITPPPASRRRWMLGLAVAGCVLCIALPAACWVLSLVIYR